MSHRRALAEWFATGAAEPSPRPTDGEQSRLCFFFFFFLFAGGNRNEMLPSSVRSISTSSQGFFRVPRARLPGGNIRVPPLQGVNSSSASQPGAALRGCAGVALTQAECHRRSGELRVSLERPFQTEDRTVPLRLQSNLDCGYVLLGFRHRLEPPFERFRTCC